MISFLTILESVCLCLIIVSNLIFVLYSLKLLYLCHASEVLRDKHGFSLPSHFCCVFFFKVFLCHKIWVPALIHFFMCQAVLFSCFSL